MANAEEYVPNLQNNSLGHVTRRIYPSLHIISIYQFGFVVGSINYFFFFISWTSSNLSKIWKENAKKKKHFKNRTLVVKLYIVELHLYCDNGQLHVLYDIAKSTWILLIFVINLRLLRPWQCCIPHDCFYKWFRYSLSVWFIGFSWCHFALTQIISEAEHTWIVLCCF